MVGQLEHRHKRYADASTENEASQANQGIRRGQGKQQRTCRRHRGTNGQHTTRTVVINQHPGRYLHADIGIEIQGRKIAKGRRTE